MCVVGGWVGVKNTQRSDTTVRIFSILGKDTEEKKYSRTHDFFNTSFVTAQHLGGTLLNIVMANL